MVVPEKILMKKIKKREKMKKQLVANKQAGKSKADDDDDVSNEHSECMYKNLSSFLFIERLNSYLFCLFKSFFSLCTRSICQIKQKQ